MYDPRDIEAWLIEQKKERTRSPPGSGRWGSGNGSRRLAARYATEEEVHAGRLVGKTIGQVLLCETREEGGYVGLARPNCRWRIPDPARWS